MGGIDRIPDIFRPAVREFTKDCILRQEHPWLEKLLKTGARANGRFVGSKFVPGTARKRRKAVVWLAGTQDLPQVSVALVTILNTPALAK